MHMIRNSLELFLAFSTMVESVLNVPVTKIINDARGSINFKSFTFPKFGFLDLDIFRIALETTNS